MNFDNRTVTYAGATLLAHSDSVKKATIVDSIIISSNTPSNSADYAKLTFGDFGNYKEFPVINIRQSDNTFQPEALVTNEGFTRDFPMSMVGLKAHTDGENNAALIAVTVDNSNTPFTIPAQTSVPYKLFVDLPIGYSNSKNVQMNVNNAGMVTSEDVNQIITLAIQNLETIDNHNKDINSLAVQIQGVASAIGNNTSIAQSFADINTKVDSNATYIKKVETDKDLKEYKTDHNKDINDLKNSISNGMFKFQGNWDGNVNDLVAQPDGIYGLMNNKQGCPTWFSGFGIVVKYHNDTDLFMNLFDNSGHSGSFSKFGNWVQNANGNDLVNLQNTVNGVLARQSILIEQQKKWISGSFPFDQYVGCNQSATIGNISYSYDINAKTFYFSGTLNLSQWQRVGQHIELQIRLDPLVSYIGSTSISIASTNIPVTPNISGGYNFASNIHNFNGTSGLAINLKWMDSSNYGYTGSVNLNGATLRLNY